MAEPTPFKEQADAVKLRQNPRPITRVNRKVLMLGTGLGLVLLFAGMAVAFSPPKLIDQSAPREVYAQRNGLPEGLASMPASYDALARIPELGPSLPGEFGAAFLATERREGLDPPRIPYGDEPFRHDPEQDAARAARIAQAEQAQKAREAPVFFQLSNAARAVAPRQDQFSHQPASWAPSDPFLATGSAGGATDPNGQVAKLAFAGSHVTDTQNPNRLQPPTSPYQLMAGAILPASLITGVNSDLPGTVVAQVTQNVFDTVAGRHLLVPQGTRLIGRYDSGVSFGQDRALLVWDRMILPDGTSLVLNGLPGADASGASGLRDRVDHHWGRLAGATALATLLGVGAELATDNNADEIGEAVRDAFQDTAGRAGDRVIQRQLGIQPTIRIRAGAKVQVIVTRDLILQPFSKGATR